MQILLRECGNNRRNRRGSAEARGSSTDRCRRANGSRGQKENNVSEINDLNKSKKNRLKCNIIQMERFSLFLLFAEEACLDCG